MKQDARSSLQPLIIDRLTTCKPNPQEGQLMNQQAKNHTRLNRKKMQSNFLRALVGVTTCKPSTNKLKNHLWLSPKQNAKKSQAPAPRRTTEGEGGNRKKFCNHDCCVRWWVTFCKPSTSKPKTIFDCH